MASATIQGAGRGLSALGVVLLILGCGASGAGPPAAGAGRASGPVGRCRARSGLPDPACTPGSVLSTDPGLVCRRGYANRTRRVGPYLKHLIYRAYEVPAHVPGSFEIDHLIPLELGGANRPSNLWPQAARPRPGYREKDALEDYLHERVCAGRLPLVTAQREIARDWITLYRRLAPGSP